MGWKMYYNHKDTFFGSRILQIVLKTDQQLSSPFLLMVSMHILGSPSTRMQGNFSEIASCRVQKMAEASANNGSQGKIFLAQPLVIHLYHFLQPLLRRNNYQKQQHLHLIWSYPMEGTAYGQLSSSFASLAIVRNCFAPLFCIPSY